MKIALFCKPVEITFLKSLYTHFQEQNISIHSAYIETSFRKKYSKNEVIYNEAHYKFNNATNKYGFNRRLRRIIWRHIPQSLKVWLWRNLHLIPYFNRHSVEKFAFDKGIKVHRVRKHSSEETRILLEKNEIDYVILLNSNWLIKEPLLSMPNTKIINAHGGKLPEHRGLDANLHALKEGSPVGITSHFVDKDIDTGPIILFKECKLNPGEGINDLHKAISNIRKWVFSESLNLLSNPDFKAEIQTVKYPIHQPFSFEELMQLNMKLMQQ